MMKAGSYLRNSLAGTPLIIDIMQRHLPGKREKYVIKDLKLSN
jgi:hypothetical protein